MEMLLVSAHFLREVPCATARASWVFRLSRASPDIAQTALGDNLSPRFLLAPLAVLSQGPRLAGTPSRGKQMTMGKSETG
ncbi:MAG: hypothetical protein ACLQVF_33105 [Isosphaeraceae bacterium]